MNNKEIFIDLDGTLVDIAPRHYRVYRSCVDAFSGNALDFDEYWKMKREDQSWGTLLERSSLPKSIEPQFLQRFISRIEVFEELARDALFDFSTSALEKISDRNTLYLLSLRRNTEALHRQVDALGISQYFSQILSGHSDTKTGTLAKKADIIKATIAYPDQSLVIGDTEADVVAAQSISALSIAVSSGIRSRKFLDNLKPEYIFDNIQEVSNTLF